MFQEL